jgi:hypothetical protein
MSDRPVEMTVAREVAPPPPMREQAVRPDRPTRDALPVDDEVR